MFINEQYVYNSRYYITELINILRSCILLVIVGKSQSGKSSVVKKLDSMFCMKSIIAYTTRPKRKGERDGVDYNFIPEEEFLRLVDKGFFAEYASFNHVSGTVYYGTAKEDITDDKVLISNNRGLQQLPRELCYIVYLEVSDETIKERADIRGDDPIEVNRRLKSDALDFADMSDKADLIINVSDNPQLHELAYKIFKAYTSNYLLKE